MYVRGSGELRTKKLREVWVSPTSALHQDLRGGSMVSRDNSPRGPRTASIWGPEVQGAGKNTGKVGNTPSKAHIKWAGKRMR